VRVTIAAGGTAGHVSPAIALAHRLADDHGADVVFAGTPGGQESRLIPAAGFRLETFEAAPFVRKLSLRNVRAPAIVMRSVGRAAGLVARSDVVVGMGGYVSVPVGLAALRARRPLVLHEQNAVPGLANRLLSRPSRVVALSFAEAASLLARRVRTVVTGNPVRPSIASVRAHRGSLRAEAVAAFGFEADRRTLFVTGGSQGALHLDRAIVDAVALLRDRADLQILLVTGPAHHHAIRASLSATGDVIVRTLPFLERMELAYASADVMLSRAGAATVAEITACGLPSILVPYPYATGRHQEANAKALERAGAATIVMDDALSGAMVAQRVAELLDAPERSAAMGERAAAWGHPDADRKLADVVAVAAGAGR
jgi:UDP-N-acetylglucosamine--N-acetylmuramyl-(pentapeptide) pyrophosphoryl-undecaprenol N-acetylglucosamine transferase